MAININVSAAQEVSVSGMAVDIVLDMDAYASEVGIAFREGNAPAGTPADIWAGSNAGNSLLFVNNGDISNGTSAYNQNVTLSSLGCHYLVTYDNYGDGITYQYAGGHAEINGTTSMTIPGGWASGGVFGVNFTSGSGVDDSELVDYLSIFPNPAVDMTNVQLNLTDNTNVTISMVNALGQVVYTNNLGEVSGNQNVEINTTDLEEGIYLVNIQVGDDVITKRISVIK